MPVKSEAEALILLNWNGTQYAWTEVSGGDVSREAEQYPLALKNEMDSVLSTSRVSNVTLRVPFDVDTCNELMSKADSYCGESIDLIVQSITVCPEDESDGQPITYLGLKPLRDAPPSRNRSSTSVAMFEMEFSVRKRKVG